MCYFIIIRGPAGAGKTAVSKKLAARLGGTYISFDKIMHDNHLDKIDTDCITEENFIKANKIVIPRAIEHLEKGKIVIFDGCFYHESQIEHLVKNIPFNSFVFTLKATLQDCISRDKKRRKNARIGEKSVRDVYDLVSRFDYGILRNTDNKIPEEIATDILDKISGNFSEILQKNRKLYIHSFASQIRGFKAKL